MKTILLILGLIITSCASHPPTTSNSVTPAPEGMDKEEVRRKVRENLPSFKNCYNPEWEKNKKLEGKIVISWKVKKDGSVENEQIESTTMNNPVVEKCLLGILKKTTFPKPPEGSIAEIKYPFYFKGQ